MVQYSSAYVAGITLYLEDPVKNPTATGYSLTDHNRDKISISYEQQQFTQRMARGEMRRFIASNKRKISTTWKDMPTAGGILFTADGNVGAAWLKSFYEQNVFYPVWVQLVYSNENWAATLGKSNVNTLYNSGAAASTNNSTFNQTWQSGQSPMQQNFQISAVSASAGPTFGTLATTFTTSIPHNFNLNQSVFVNGIDQIFNGNYQISSIPSSNQFVISSMNANFNINSYNIQGTTGVFNVDNTDFLSAAMTAGVTEIDVLGSINALGAYTNINGVWVVTSVVSNTVFTASSLGGWYSDTAFGYNANANLYSTAPNYVFNKPISQFNPYVVINANYSEVIKSFITNFTEDITKRLTYTDLADIQIEFTEI